MPASDVKNGNPVRYWATPKTFTDGQDFSFQGDASGNVFTSLGTALAGEDLVNNVIKVEERFTYQQFTIDTLVKTGAGFLHTLTFACSDAAPTAGTIDVYDNTSAAGTKIFTWTLGTTVFFPSSVIIDCSFATGLYVDFTTTADVSVTVSYR